MAGTNVERATYILSSAGRGCIQVIYSKARTLRALVRVRALAVAQYRNRGFSVPFLAWAV